MESMYCSIILSIATTEPDAVLPNLDRIYAAFVAIPNADTPLAMVVGKCGQAEGGAEKATKMLCGLLGEPTLGPHGPAVILGLLPNLFEALGEANAALLDPYMGLIRSHAGSAAASVEKIEDWRAGRSLKKTDERLAAVEAKVAALNADFAKTCKNLEEVSAMMDEKIADLKDFVGEVVKKLPQPSKLEVVGGARKTLLLHFSCCRTGGTVTTETKEWNQWCKVGFGLIKLGKCAAVAAAGNPMALMGGVGAIKDIYNGCAERGNGRRSSFCASWACVRVPPVQGNAHARTHTSPCSSL